MAFPVRTPLPRRSALAAARAAGSSPAEIRELNQEVAVAAARVALTTASAAIADVLAAVTLAAAQAAVTGVDAVVDDAYNQLTP